LWIVFGGLVGLVDFQGFGFRVERVDTMELNPAPSRSNRNKRVKHLNLQVKSARSMLFGIGGAKVPL
jgi:hypothetical protein